MFLIVCWPTTPCGCREKTGLHFFTNIRLQNETKCLAQGHNGTSTVSPDGILVCCPNQLDWLLWRWRNCRSTQSSTQLAVLGNPCPREIQVHPVKEVPLPCLNLWSLLFVYSLQLMNISQDMQTPADELPISWLVSHFIPLLLANKRARYLNIHFGKGLLGANYTTYCRTKTFVNENRTI